VKPVKMMSEKVVSVSLPAVELRRPVSILPAAEVKTAVSEHGWAAVPWVPVVMLAFGLFGAVLLVLLTLLYREGSGVLAPWPHFIHVQEKDLVSANTKRYSRSMDISRLRNFSFLVVNDGPHPVEVQPELSPDKVIWGSFGEQAYVLNSGEGHLFVPQFFLHYCRVKFRNRLPGRNSRLTVWFQGQS